MIMKSSNLWSQMWVSILALVFCLLFLACHQSASGLDSETFIGHANPSTGSTSGAWSRFEDPFEHAFALSVPRGWTVKGGLFRMGFSDQRVMVDLRSPDGKIDLRLGDVSVPSYSVPNTYHYREGEIYDLGAQAQMVVERYRTGPEYAVRYSESRFATVCKNPQQNPSNVDFSMPDYLPVGSMQGQSSAGQVEWLCQTDQGPRVALAFTRTTNTGEIWQVPTMVSLIAPPDQIEKARSIALHCVQSLQVNPQWLAYQQNMDAQGIQYQRARQQKRRDDINAQVVQFESQMRAMQNQVNSFEHHQALQANQVEGFTNALVGLTPTTDPMTGENRMVWTGPKDNYWVNGTGQVVNSTNAPSSSFHQLQTH
jgi:hypothetical protein